MHVHHLPHLQTMNAITLLQKSFVDIGLDVYMNDLRGQFSHCYISEVNSNALEMRVCVFLG